MVKIKNAPIGNSNTPITSPSRNLIDPLLAAELDAEKRAGFASSFAVQIDYLGHASLVNDLMET